MTKLEFSYVQTILKELSYNVAAIDFQGNTMWFIYSSFDHSISGSSASVSFNQMKGIDITDIFLQTNMNILNQRSQFLQTLQSYIAQGAEVNIKFNEKMPYFLFMR